VSPQPKIQRIKGRGSCRPVDWASTSYPLFIKSLVQALSDIVKKMRWHLIMHEPHVVVNEKAHVPRVLVNHSPKNDGMLVC
jgi:hypothetical protein